MVIFYDDIVAFLEQAGYSRTWDKLVTFLRHVSTCDTAIFDHRITDIMLSYNPCNPSTPSPPDFNNIILKKGSRFIASNYRPVSLTCHIIKIYERILRKQMIRHLDNNDLLCDNQHGFRAGRIVASLNCSIILMIY